MAFSSKVGSITALKKKLNEAQSDDVWIKYIPDGSIRVRFLEEVEEWANYYEHWDANARKYFPCKDDYSCAGCKLDMDRSVKYLTNAVLLDDKSLRVVPLKIPQSLANRLAARAEKYKTITDRDYELMRSGKGLDTEYDLDSEAPDKRKFPKVELHDLEKVLRDAYTAVFGDEDDDERKPRKPKKESQTAEVAKTKKKHEVVEDDVWAATPKDPVKGKKKVVIPDYTLTDLEDMPLGRLRGIARDNEIDPTGLSQAKLAKKIADVLNVPPF